MAKKKESDFQKLAKIIKKSSDNVVERLMEVIRDESEETRAVLRTEFKTDIARVERKMDVGFFDIKTRFDDTVQSQLDDHAHRIKIVEDRPLSR